MASLQELWQQGFNVGKVGGLAVIPRDVLSQGSKAAKAWMDGYRQGLERKRDVEKQEPPS